MTTRSPAELAEEIENDVSQTRDRAEALHRVAEAFKDAGVLQPCHAAFESLEGAPKHIFDGVTDRKKREAVDELLKQTKRYLNSGRHVSKSDDSQRGSFPVDHRDAEFALYLSRVFLTYTAKLLATGP